MLAVEGGRRCEDRADLRAERYGVVDIVAQARRVREEHPQTDRLGRESRVAKGPAEPVGNVAIEVERAGFHQAHHPDRDHELGNGSDPHLVRGLERPLGSAIGDANLPVILSVMGIAAGAGGWIVLLFGALTAIPQDLLEAARLDGAGAWHLVRYVKLPMIRGYVAFILIVSFANGFQVFVEPQVLAAAAPGRVSQYWSVNQLVYSYATGESNYGRASALSL